MKWLASGLELARRVLRHHADEETAFSIPDEVFMAFWLSESVSEAGMSACLDAFKALMKFDSDMKRLERKHGEARRLRAGVAREQFSSLVGHTWISTEDGRFGLATPGCQSGDRVAVFYSGAPLYIIRPHEGRKDSTTEDVVIRERKLKPKREWTTKERNRFTLNGKAINILYCALDRAQ